MIIGQKPNLYSSQNPLVRHSQCVSKPILIQHDDDFKTKNQPLSFKSKFGYATKYIDTCSVAGSLEKVLGGNYAEKFQKTVGKLEKHGLIKPNGSDIEKDGYSYEKKTVLRKLAEAVVYPFYHMVLDMSNWLISQMKKDWQQSLRKGILKTRHENVELEKKLNIVTSLCEKDGKDDLVKLAHRALDPMKAKYSTLAERTLTTIVIGMWIGPKFQGIDAYNTAMEAEDNSKDAEKMRDKRAKQEMIGGVGEMISQLIVLKALSEFTNKSLPSALLVLLPLALATEIVARKIAGMPITPISKEKAREMGMEDSDEPSTFKANIETQQEHKEESEKENVMGNVALKIAMAILGLAGVGCLAKRAAKNSFVEKQLNKISKFKQGITKEKVVFEKKEYDELVEKLGIKGLKEKYSDLIERKDGKVYLGQRDKKFIAPLFEMTVEYPVKIAKALVMIPYHIITGGAKFLNNAFKTSFKQALDKATKKKARTIEDRQEEAQNALMWMRDKVKEFEKEFKGDKVKINNKINEKLEGNVFDSLDSTNVANFSINKLSISKKYLAGLFSFYFAFTDRFNIAASQSKGEDMDLAQQKGQEASMQKVAKYIFSGWIVHSFTELNKFWYSKSLLGVAATTAATGFTYNYLERASIGAPIKESTRAEIDELSEKNKNRTGLSGKYFATVRKLTGKDNLEQKHSA